MTMKKYINNDARSGDWDIYVRSHGKGTLYHLYRWKEVINETYRHKTYYLSVTEETGRGGERIVGVLPLVHLKHPFFGNSMISLPFFDLGGLLADNPAIEQLLIKEAISLGWQLGASNIELRQNLPLESVGDFDRSAGANAQQQRGGQPHSLPAAVAPATKVAASTNKVRMLLALQGTSVSLLNSYKSKLRSQIRKPLKEGLCPKIGGEELLEDFYRIFAVNMRDLGSPVHSKDLMKNVLRTFKDEARIFAVYKEEQPVAAGLVVGFEKVLANPWASALRQYSHLSANMLLYWSMLEYACNQGYQYFDFGRSTPGEGSYRFKEQWGAQPVALCWYDIRFEARSASAASEKGQFQKAIHYWQKIPVPLSKFIGPMLRKHIGL